MNKKALVLCPPNITLPYDGPNGNLGDRVHQLPAIKAAASSYSEVFVWPKDSFTDGLFQSQGVKFISNSDLSEITREIQQLSIDDCFCLFAEPLEIPQHRRTDATKLEVAHKISQVFSRDHVSRPVDLDPRGGVAIWKKLLISVDPTIVNTLQWPVLPFLYPTEQDRVWMREQFESIRPSQPVIIASPFSGKKAETIEGFWQDLVKLSRGTFFVPVHKTDLERANSLLGDFENVKILEADFSKMAALASYPNTHVIGIDGGPMNVFAASRAQGVLAIYSSWPASAWALPNITARSPDISAKDALLAMP